MNDCYFCVQSPTGEFAQCEVLDIKKCLKNCKFKKTKAEFFDGLEKSKQYLSDKGLKPYTTSENGKQIVTVKKI